MEPEAQVEAEVEANLVVKKSNRRPPSNQMQTHQTPTPLEKNLTGTLVEGYIADFQTMVDG